MENNTFAVKYQGREAKIVRGQRLPDGCYQVKLENTVGMPIADDFVRIWDCTFPSEDAANEIFRRLFGLDSEDALELDFKSGHNVALLISAATSVK